jgi:predicted AAA+ superfamily ATPase
LLHYFDKHSTAMMERDLLKLLNTRISVNDYRPILIAGVNGSGKTTLGGMFAKRFAQSMAFSLSKAHDRQVFENFRRGELHFSDLFLYRNRDPYAGRTLLFMDDVHVIPEIWDMIVNLPNRPVNLFILGASDVAVRGRQSAVRSPQSASCILNPASFAEFLAATGETELLASYLEVPCPDHVHDKLLALFHRYVLVGGMPEAVMAWIDGHSMMHVGKAFDRILAGWDQLLRQEVAGKKSAALAATLLADAFPFASSRISYSGFGNRPVQSREAAQAFRSLESLMFLELVHPLTGTGLDAQSDTGRSPRLQFADTGMVIHFSGIRQAVSATNDLTTLFGGQVLRHVAGQEILAANSRLQTADCRPAFWVRSKPQSHAEVDFVIPYGDLLVPVVARAGEPGRLRALHSFIDAAPHPYAVRLGSERLNVRKAETIAGKTFYLLSLPYYLAGKITEHLEGFVKYVTS